MKVRKNALEWTVFGVALLIVIGTVVMLAIEMTRNDDAPADLVVTTGRVERSPSGYRVPVRVTNRGDRTASSVHLQLALETATGDVEQVELTFPFVPRRSSRDATAVFHRDPSCCTLTVRSVGFESPR